MSTMAIDPGNVESAYVVVDDDCKPLRFGKVANDELMRLLVTGELIATRTVIEMIASYGMPVGAEVFDTCVWIGKFVGGVEVRSHSSAKLVKRLPVKLHHCHTAKAKDSNIIQALVDRFAMGEPNRGKGTKKNPGFFYGFKADVWQAMALAVYAVDTAPSSSPDASETGKQVSVPDEQSQAAETTTGRRR